MGKGYDFISSHAAYKENPDRKDYCRQVVFTAIRKLQPCTDKQIAEFLNWPINRVTPRRGELESKGLIQLKCKAPDEVSKRLVSYWQIKEIIQFKQPELFN